jgi:hypothetical protein
MTQEEQAKAEEQNAAEDEKNRAEPNPDEGWGWWTAMDEQKKWLRFLAQHVPFPAGPEVLPRIDDMAPLDLQRKLQEFGGYLVWLNAMYGVIEGKQKALLETYDVMLTAAKGKFTDPKLYSTESAKAAAALNDGEVGAALRSTKRRLIEVEAVHAAHKRLIDAYEHGWNTISRQMSMTIGEMGLATHRTGG